MTDTSKTKSQLINELEELRKKLSGSDSMQAEGMQGEEALKKSEASSAELEELIHIYDTSPVGMSYVDTQLRYVRINSKLAKMNGLSIEEHIGKTVMEVLPEIADTVVPTYQQVIKTGKGLAFEVQGETRAEPGVMHDWLVSYYPLKSVNGTVKGVTAVVQEITESKRANEALKESEYRLQSILDYSTTVIYVKDLDGKYLLINKRFENLFGVTRDKVINRNDHDIFPEDIAKTFRGNDLEVLKINAPVEFEEVAPHDNGPHTYISIKFPLYDATGTTYAVCGISTDITDRKMSEDMLQRAHEELEIRVKDRTRDLTKEIEVRKLAEEVLKKTQDNFVRAQEVGHIGSWHLDLTTNKLVWTAESYRIFGLPIGTPMTYEKFLELVHPEDREYVGRRWTSAMEGELYDIEHRLLVGNEVKWVREKAELTFDSNGNPLSCIGIVQDITEKKMQEKDIYNLAGDLILKQEKEMSRIARELHDDLTQQLAVIAIDAGIVEQDLKDIPEVVLQKVVHIKKQLIKMSENVHRIARDLHPSILDDLGLVRAIQSECTDFSARTGIAVIFTPQNVPENLPNSIALPVYRIIQEGLSNIIKYAGVKNAYIFLEASGDSILLTVRDTGVGFDSNQVKKVPGLGLRDIRERARLIGGRSSITSSPGKGTTIEVSIPLNGETV